VAYLVNQTRVSSLTIGGVDYTDNLISFTVTDSSANKNGIIQTAGSLILGEIPNGNSLGDYNRNAFKRGTIILLDLEDPETSVVTRHPRGYLYVISGGYSAESGSLELSIGCRLTLSALTEEVDEILPLVPVPLELERQDFGNCAASFASAGQCLYQDNQGVLQVVTFFDGDVNDTAAPGEWTSVLGVTALTASPMLGGSAIPDTLLLSFQVPQGAIGSNELGKIDETVTDSYYFLNYPTTLFRRITTGLSAVSGSSSSSTGIGVTSGCGNSPGEPGDNPDLITCNEGYRTEQEPSILPAQSQEISRTYYSGPASQGEKTITEKWGPAVELNGQYFSDLFAYCRYTWATRCLPNGTCAFEGMEQVLQSYNESYNYYGPSGEVVQTVQDSYSNILSAAQPFDWRAGVVDGLPQEFRPINYINGTTQSYIRQGSGLGLVYRNKATTLKEIETQDGFYYTNGNLIYLSKRDSNGVLTTSNSVGLPAIMGIAAGQYPVCVWQYNASIKGRELVCNYPVIYISTQEGNVWPIEASISQWGLYIVGYTTVGTQPYIVRNDFDDLPDGDVLYINDAVATVAVTSPNGVFFRDQRTVTDYLYSGDGNIQTTTTYSSVASNSVGIYRSSLDALNGIVTVQRRTSRTITANPIAPDRISPSNSSTVEQSSEYPIFTSTYQESVDRAGPYILRDAIPVPLLFANKDTLAGIVNTYSNYLIRFIKGDALGYTIAESLRPEIIENWRPGMPFRYCDQEKNRILALRMDGCSWGVTATETGVVTNGIWIGNSDGALVLSSNLSGNSTPSLDGDPPTPPVGPAAPPSIANEVYVSSGPISLVIQVDIGTKILLPFDESRSIISVIEPLEVDLYTTFMCFVSGLVVAPGNLLGTTSTGSVPIDANGSLVTAGATIIISELFPNFFTAPIVSVSVSIPNTIISVPLLNPTVISGASVSPPSASIETNGLAPILTGAGAVVDPLPLVATQVDAPTPGVSIGDVVFLPYPANTDLVPLAPSFVGGWQDPYWSSTNLMLTLDTNFTDSSQKAIATSVIGANATISTVTKRFGAGSVYLSNTTNAYFTYSDPSGHLSPGLGDFTAEFWWYPFETETTRLWASSTAGWRISQTLFSGVAIPDLLLNGTLYYPGTNTGTATGTFTYTLLSWHHVALTRNSGVYRLFLNGTLTTTVTNQTGTNQTSSWNQFGREGVSTTNSPYGYMDECRFTKGIARYTSNFTPPTTAFPNPFPR
jgi:hypothetical protein